MNKRVPATLPRYFAIELSHKMVLAHLKIDRILGHMLRSLLGEQPLVMP